MHSALEGQELIYQEPSRFPGIDMDLSLLVPEGMRFADMEAAWAGAGETLKDVSLIDSFEQNGKKSLTLRLAFSSREKTLSKEEVQPVVDSIVAKLSAAGAALRG